MKIILLKNYGLSATGDVLDVSQPMADLLIGRKVAEVSDEKNKVKNHRRITRGKSDKN